MSEPTREDAQALDAADALAGFRARFVDDDPELLYLDGNSLGRLPRAAVDAVAARVAEWGTRLVGAWPDWIDLPSRVGDLLATRVLGAHAGEVIVCDSTTVNLYKLASAALDSLPGRPAVVVDAGDFPTNRYVLEGLAAARGLPFVVVSADPVEGPGAADVERACAEADVALLVLSHVNYRSGALVDMAAVNAVAAAAGALVVWDLSHAAGAVPVELERDGSALAVGCTYKYLCGGPGAPAFLYVAERLQSRLRSPVWGWFGQADQFAMGPAYDPVPGIGRFLAGTPPILDLAAVEAGVAVVAEAGPAAIRAKSVALTELAVALHDTWLAPLGFSLGTPRDPARRGAHVSLRHPQGWQICQALADWRVVADFRSPDSVRIGLAPLSTRYVDVFDALARLRELVTAGAHQRFEPAPGRVT